MAIALAAGVICAAIVAAYFIAIDQFRAAATANGVVSAPTPRQPVLKQLESLLRPVSGRLPAHTAAQVRHKLSRAGDPGGLTPAGFQALRYSLAALLAIVGLAFGVVFNGGLPVLVASPVLGALFAALGYFIPNIWLDQRIGGGR